MGNKLNILFICGPHFGGAEYILYLLLKFLNKSKFHPIVLLPEEGLLSERMKGIDVQVIYSPLESLNGLKVLMDIDQRVSNIVNIIDHYNISLVQTQLCAYQDGALAAKVKGIPHIFSVHGIISDQMKSASNEYVNFYHTIIDMLSDKIITVSNRTKEKLANYIEPNKITVIYNGIEPDKYSHLINNKIMELSSEGNNKKNILTLGRVHWVKNHDLLIRASAIVKKVLPSANFQIVGSIQDYSLYQKLLKRVKELQLSDIILFSDFADDIEPLLQTTDLLVIPSITESFSIVALQAMASGIPVVSTRCGGPEEVILDGKSGYLVQNDNEHALAEAIITLLKNQEKARLFGLKGRERVINDFDIRTKTLEYETVFEETIKNHKRKDKANSKDIILIKGLMDLMGKYGNELWEMDKRLKKLEWFDKRVKTTWAYKCYRLAKLMLNKTSTSFNHE